MDKPTLAECVEVLREMHAFAESVNDLREAKAFSRAIEVCERVQDDLACDNACVPACALDMTDSEHYVYTVGLKDALAWARGGR